MAISHFGVLGFSPETRENLWKIIKTYQGPDKAPFIIYVDLKCVIEKTDGCKNNPENSFTTNLTEHIPLGF